MNTLLNDKLSIARAKAKLLYQETEELSDGSLRVKLNGKVGLIDNTGRLLARTIYEHVEVPKDGYCVVKLDTMYGVLNSSGEYIIEPKYKKIYNIRDKAFRAEVEYGRWEYLDEEGKVICSAEYMHADDFSEGLAAVYDSSSHNWGYIDKTGKVVLETQYSEAYRFARGRAKVGIKIADAMIQYYFIDKQGRILGRIG